LGKGGALIIVMTLVFDNEAKKEYLLKRLKELSEKSLGEIPQLDEPTEQQNRWIKRRMRQPARSWDTSIEHKPWILRWHYFIFEDYER
jgi:hypothetical protein